MNDQRIKLVRGDFNYNGDGKHSDCGHWIAGNIPVGSTGTVKLVRDVYPQYRGNENGPYCIVWDHNPEPKAGYYWGYTPGYKYETIEPIESV